jgi:CRP-like cAMP-binding protein
VQHSDKRCLYLRLSGYIQKRSSIKSPKMTENFLNLFDSYVQLTEDDIALCEQYFELQSFPKNSILEQENKVPKHLYFITEGFMRLFYDDDNGDDVTILIASPNRFITPLAHTLPKTQTKRAGEVFQNRYLLFCSTPSSLYPTVCLTQTPPQYFAVSC